jgi:hypothetical protein
MSHTLRKIDIVGMDSDLDFRHSVNLVMFAIAAGEEHAIWDLHQLAEPSLQALVRREAARVGVHLNADDVFDLTLDAAMELGRMARAWNPAGALPWVWARKRLLALVQAHLGTFTRELHDEVLERAVPPTPVPMEEPVAALRRLAERHDGARALQERLEELVSPRDADIWLAFQVERDGGNRSPAVTIAVDHGMRPDAVRKVVQRVTERLASSDTVLQSPVAA